MEITIREFESKDIPNKVKWINDLENNRFLHYDLPLEVNKTEAWFEKNKDNQNRYDAVIEVNENPVGIIGLLNINEFKAEYYITIGEHDYRGNNIAKRASQLLFNYAFSNLNLEKVYLYTEMENIPMQKLAQKLGMFKESLLSDHLIRDGEYRNCYYYTLTKKDYCNGVIFPEKVLSNINYLYSDTKENNIYIKRDDLIPFSFGGNKARKARHFFKKIIADGYTTVVTYGSKSSNHCRVVSNLCSKYNLNCVIISPYSDEPSNYNRTLIELTESQIVECEVKDVSSTIDYVVNKETESGEKVFFIPGGGHGNMGTQAYVDAYHEIVVWERQNKVNFDYIFLASGTGTTQAGLIVGQLLHKNFEQKIIGISIARERERGTEVISASLQDYFNSTKSNTPDNSDRYITFIDDYIAGGYGKSNESIRKTVRNIYLNNGIPLNETYTGKAYYGMKKYVESEKIYNKNILFINTGGSPLFFNTIG